MGFIWQMNMNLHDKAVWDVLNKLADDDDKIVASAEKIAELAGVHRNTVTRVTCDLERFGKIERRVGKGRSPNIYCIIEKQDDRSK